MNVGSLFSGVGGIDLGLERAGWRVVFQCESDPWCRGILAQHWPGVPCYDDVRDVGLPHDAGPDQRTERDPGAGRPQPVRSVDLLAGGFPCQDLSVAGQRAGLSGGERSSLFFEFARIADDLVRPGGWVLIENVPGLLSSHGGRDFAVLLATLAELGFHDLAWRVLDSRYFGVPQRRRRVFIVGRRAVGACAQQVLLEPESGGGDFAPSREARARTSLLAEGGAVQSLDRQAGGADDNSAQAGHLIAPALVKRYAKGTDSDATDCLIAGTVRSHMRPGSNAFDVVGAPADPHGVRAPAGLPGRVDDPVYAIEQIGRKMSGGPEVGLGVREGEMYTLDRDGRHGVMGSGSGEAHDPPPDGPRYAAMGNAVTVSVAEWLGRRIMTVAAKP